MIPLEAAGITLLVVTPLVGVVWAVIRLLGVYNLYDEYGGVITILISVGFMAACIASSMFIVR